MTTAPRTTESLVGAVVDGRYRILAPIGEGGVGAVYRCEQLQGGPQVALKVLHDQYGTDAESKERFQREARALNGLQHPNIVGVMDYGLFGAGPFLVMELLAGATLDAIIERGDTKDPALAYKLACDVVRGMAYAHSLGVLHRDLKPENVFVAKQADGTMVAKLLDFGLAKFVDQDRWGADNKLTMTGAVFGTPAYMSPEQGTGQKVDMRSDVYSAGAMVYEIFTGQWPFMEEERLQMLRAHLTQPPPKITSVRDDLEVRPELEQVIATSMAKKPADRYQDCGAMLAALQAIAQPVARIKGSAQPQAQAAYSPPPQAGYSPPAPAPQNPSASGGMNLLVLGAIGGGVLLLLLIVAVAAVFVLR